MGKGVSRRPVPEPYQTCWAPCKCFDTYAKHDSHSTAGSADVYCSAVTLHLQGFLATEYLRRIYAKIPKRSLVTVVIPRQKAKAKVVISET